MSSWLLPRYRNHWIFVQIAVYIAYAFQWGPQCFSSLKFTTCFLLIHSNKNWTNVHNNFWKLKGGGGWSVFVWDRETEREGKTLIVYVIVQNLLIHKVDLGFPVRKINTSTQCIHTFYTSDSFCLSPCPVSLAREVVMIGPESHVSHT